MDIVASMRESSTKVVGAARLHEERGEQQAKNGEEREAKDGSRSERRSPPRSEMAVTARVTQEYRHGVHTSLPNHSFRKP